MKRSLILVFALPFLSSCGPDQERWFEPMFNLTAFLSEQVPQPQTEVTFQVCSKDKKPLPFGLLRFDWDDNGGRMSFQTDAKGEIAMKFDENIMESTILVSIDQKPEGQKFIEAGNYEDTTESVPNGYIRVHWR